MTHSREFVTGRLRPDGFSVGSVHLKGVLRG